MSGKGVDLNFYFLTECRIPMRLSRGAAIFFVAAVLGGPAACDRAKGKTGESGRTLTVGLEANPTILDPRVALDVYATRIFPLIFEGLFEIGQNSEPLPQLVSSFEQSDALTYVFHLKPGRFFPDGRELTAADAAFTLSSLAEPSLKSPKKALLDKIAEIKVLDRYTIQLKLKEPYAPFLTDLAFGIVPATAVKKMGESFGRKPFGSGPYLVESFEAGSAVVLTVNPKYGGPRPSFDRLVFRVIPDDVTRVMALERGEISLLLNSTPPDDLPRLQSNPRFNIIMEPGVNYVYLGMNLTDPALKDVRVRRAIAYAIDRESLIHCLLRDTVNPAAGLLAPSHWAYDPEVMPYEFNPEKAKALLDEAGFPDPDGDGPRPRFKLIYKTSQLKQGRWVAEAVGEQLKKVGLEIEVRSFEWGTYFADIISGNFQLYSLTWVGTTDPDLYYFIFHSTSAPPNGANRNRYANPDFDRLAEQGRRTLERSERKIIYSRVQQLLAQDLPCISLWYNKNIVVSDRRLHGFVLYPSGDFRSLATAGWE